MPEPIPFRTLKLLNVEPYTPSALVSEPILDYPLDKGDYLWDVFGHASDDVRGKDM